MTQLVQHRTNDLFRNIRIDLAQALQHHIWQNNLFLIFTSGSVRKCIRLFCHTIQNSIIMPLLQSLNSSLLNHIFRYDFRHRITSSFLGELRRIFTQSFQNDFFFTTLTA